MKNDKQKLIACIDHFESSQQKRIALGFDAFIDVISRPIKQGNALHVEQYYGEMADFGQHLIDRAGFNCSVELDVIEKKLGGNTPNVATALGHMGAFVDCLAPFGLDEIRCEFVPIQQYGRLLSTGNPGISYAMEFDNGKVILALNQDVNKLDWTSIVNELSLSVIREAISKSDLFCFLNWSELPGASDIMHGLQNEVFSKTNVEKPLLIDLSDCARRNGGELLEFLTMVAQLPSEIRSILSMNHNEGIMVCEAIGVDNNLNDFERGKKLIENLNLHWVVLHHRLQSVLVTRDGEFIFKTKMTGPALLQTGAGDHFNAGLCFAMLHNIEPRLCLAFASMTSGYYVERAQSPSLDQLRNYIANMEEF